jgi:hypothetical protein
MPPNMTPPETGAVQVDSEVAETGEVGETAKGGTAGKKAATVKAAAENTGATPLAENPETVLENDRILTCLPQTEPIPPLQT